MPKPSQLKIKPKKSTEGSYVNIKKLINNRIVINILDFKLIESSIKKDSELCIMQLKISGRSMITWHGSIALTDFLQECKKQEANGEECFPIEDCIIIENADGSYGLQDADESCLILTAEELDELSSERKHKNRRIV